MTTNTDTPQTPRPGLMARLARLWRHRWHDEHDVRRLLPPEAVKRLGRRVAASEARHTGQVRICVEAGLPWSYIRRGASARDRAVTLFGKLRVWDTAQNNGVLIYLLVADHAIEILADRGIDAHVDAAEWAAMAQRMKGAFREGRFEDGLTQALEEVSALLVTHFPAEDDAEAPRRMNELPDLPVLL
ncbi:MAG: TPM domain-containing protein [Gammaproteobacteria bacterium]